MDLEFDDWAQIPALVCLSLCILSFTPLIIYSSVCFTGPFCGHGNRRPHWYEYQPILRAGPHPST